MKAPKQDLFDPLEYRECAAMTSKLFLPKLTVVEPIAQKLNGNLSAFSVLPGYRELETETSELTRQISQSSDENTIDRQVLADLENSLEEDSPPSSLKTEAFLGYTPDNRASFFVQELLSRIQLFSNRPVSPSVKS